MDRYSLTPLHSRQDLNKKCIELLNEEWPRSDASREHSQAKSCRPSPPMALLLIEKETDKLVGHARICRLPNRSSSCWVESVIVSRNERGRGLGKTLMFAIETYIKQFGFTEVYLSTNDQMAFYRRCGYVNCAPIVYSTVATTVFPILENLENSKPTVKSVQQITACTSKHECLPIPSSSECIYLPPKYFISSPPCPAPPPPAKSVANRNITVDHQFMYKALV